VEELFDLFDGFLKDKGYLAMGGQIIDATIVSAPKQHNSREEGVAPPASRRTKRETLASRRSHQANVPIMPICQ